MRIIETVCFDRIFQLGRIEIQTYLNGNIYYRGCMFVKNGILTNLEDFHIMNNKDPIQFSLKQLLFLKELENI